MSLLGNMYFKGINEDFEHAFGTPMQKPNIMNQKQLQNNLEILLNPHTKVSKIELIGSDDFMCYEEEIILDNGMVFLVSFEYHPYWEDSYEKESGGNYIDDFKLHFIDYSDCYGDGYEIELTGSQEHRVRSRVIAKWIKI
jgi:hypothetical protein